MTRLLFGLLLFLAFLPGKLEPRAGTIPPQQTIPQPGRLLVIGDSLTSGLYASYEQATFASQLAQVTGYQLARRHATNVTTATTVWSEVKGWNPTLIVLEIGLNDVSQGKLTDIQWLETYRILIVDMKSTGATVVVCTMFWGGIQPTHPNYERYLRYNAMIQQVAADTSAIIADLWNATINCIDCVSRGDQPSYFAPHYHGDNFHPSDEGHRIIAKTITDSLQKTIYIPMIGG